MLFTRRKKKNVRKILYRNWITQYLIIKVIFLTNNIILKDISFSFNSSLFIFLTRLFIFRNHD